MCIYVCIGTMYMCVCTVTMYAVTMYAMYVYIHTCVYIVTIYIWYVCVYSDTCVYIVTAGNERPPGTRPRARPDRPPARAVRVEP